MKRLMTVCAAVMSAVAMQFAAGAAFGETLDTLVLNGTTYTATENSTIGVLTVTDGTTGNVITVPSGMTVTASTYEGSGELTVNGGGSFILSDVSAMAKITMNGSTLKFVDSAAASDTSVIDDSADLACHIDADKASTITTHAGDNRVSDWADVRGSSVYNFTETDWTNKRPPYYRADYFNGHAVVDFGDAQDFPSGSPASAGYGGYLVGGDMIKIKDIFYVVSDYPGAKTREDGVLPQSLLTTVGKNWYGLTRGDGQLYGPFAAARTCPSWIDDVQIDPTTVDLPDGFHLVRTRLDGNDGINACALCNERNNKKGGLLYGELIVFNNVISETVAERVNRRLNWKWFNRRRVASLTLNEGATLDLADGGTLAPTALVAPAAATLKGSGVLKSPADVNLTKIVLPQDGSFAAGSGRADVYVLDAPGKLTKTGAGDLRLMALSSTSVDVQEGTLSMEIQTDTLTPAFHGDASRKDRVSHWYNTVQKGETLNLWKDVRDSAPACTTWDTTIPFYNLEGINGLSYIDFGAAKSGRTMLLADAVNVLKYEMFFAVSDSQSAYDNGRYSPFLGYVGENYYQMIRAEYGASAGLFRTAPGTVMLDGQVVAGTTLLPKGFHVVNWHEADGGAGVKGNAFARDRTSDSGGMYLGETLIYTNFIGSAERTKVNNYLINKWTDGNAQGPSYTSVNVESGAAVTLPVRSTVSSLTGVGAVTAKHVTLGSFDTVYGAPRAITGDVALGVSGTISVTGATGVKLRGPVTVLTATGGVTADSLDGWTVTTDGKFRGTVKLSVVNGALVADFMPAGLIIVVQ